MVEFVLITAATWVCTVALLAAVIISIAWLAFRARRHDVPEILAGLGRMVAPLGGWLPSRRRAASIVPSTMLANLPSTMADKARLEAVTRTGADEQ